MHDKIEVKDILGLAEPATKLIEIISSAIGTLYEPRKIRNVADAEAYKLEKITETAKKTNFNGEIEFLDGKINIKSEEINNKELKSLVVNEFNRLLKEKENIKKIADFAYAELKNDKNKTEEEIDDDWKNSFIDKGKKIYSEDLQFIFGKILAGEIQQPGSFSKRLLNILSNLSQREALIFRKISHLTINNFDKQFILSNRNILKKMGIELQDIIILEEAGLINSSSLTISGSNLYEYNNHLINFYDQKPKLQIYMLTISGCQLKNIMSNQINLDYLKEIKQEYNIKKMSHSIILTRIIQGDKINYSLANTTEI